MHKRLIKSLLLASIICIILPTNSKIQNKSNTIEEREEVKLDISNYSNLYKQIDFYKVLPQNSIKRDINNAIMVTKSNPYIVEDTKDKENNAIMVTKSNPYIVEDTKDKENGIQLSNYEVELIALLTMAEAGGESELGKRLVIDTVLNQVESEEFPNTVKGVVYSGAYVAMHNGRSSQCYVDEYICQLVREEAISRTNSKVLYFRTRHYHNFGTPEIHEGNHYFSS